MARGGAFISRRGTGEGVEVFLPCSLFPIPCSLLLQPGHHLFHHFLGSQARQLVFMRKLLAAERVETLTQPIGVVRKLLSLALELLGGPAALLGVPNRACRLLLEL